MDALREAWTGLRVTVVAWVICGLVFPALVVGIGQVFFRYQADGKMIRNASGQIVGSAEIGQYFSSPRWFWGRPSATSNPKTGKPEPYAANNSGATNYGPTNVELKQEVAANLKSFLAADPGVKADQVPLDLLESSGSGLDPDITPPSALIQVPRVARATGLPPARLTALVGRETHSGPLLQLFGSPYVNVLDLNLALQALEKDR